MHDVSAFGCLIRPYATLSDVAMREDKKYEIKICETTYLWYFLIQFLEDSSVSKLCSVYHSLNLDITQ